MRSRRVAGPVLGRRFGEGHLRRSHKIWLPPACLFPTSALHCTNIATWEANSVVVPGNRPDCVACTWLKTLGRGCLCIALAYTLPTVDEVRTTLVLLEEPFFYGASFITAPLHWTGANAPFAACLQKRPSRSGRGVPPALRCRQTHLPRTTFSRVHWLHRRVFTCCLRVHSHTLTSMHLHGSSHEAHCLRSPKIIHTSS